MAEFDEIQSQLQRIGADQVQVQLDDQFEPKAGTLVKVELDSAYWHMQPNDFLQLLEDLPDGAGSEAVKTTIEEKGPNVWRGPAPEDDRDTDL